MVAADVAQLELGAAERERASVVHHLVGDHRVGVLQRLEVLLGAALGDEGRAEILERPATGDVVEVMVAVDHVFDRRRRDFPDLVEIGLDRLRPQIADRIGGDHALGRDDEHRLIALIAEDIDVVGAVDLDGDEGGRRRGRGGGLRGRRLRRGRLGERRCAARKKQ